MRFKLLTLALALAVVSLPGHGEDLLDAYHSARANDPVLSQADATRLATGEGVNQARALLLPQISASYGLSQSSGSGTSSQSNLGTSGNEYLCSGIAAGTGTYACTGPLASDNSLAASGHQRQRTLSATLTQTIFDFSKYADLKAAHSQASAQDELYNAASQTLYVRVATAYFGVLTSEDQLKFAKANEDAYRKQYEQSDQRFKVGLSAITDVYQAKAYYEAAKSQTITAQNTLDDAKEALTQITATPTSDLKPLREELPMDPPAPADSNAWVQDAMKYNPTLISQKYNVETAEHNITAARAGHLPTINASLSRGKSSDWSENGGSSYSGNGRYGNTIGVTLSVPIFAGGGTQSRVRQSIYDRDAAQDSMESERRQVVRDTLNYYRSVISGISEVESGKASVDAGQKALDATRAGFSVGTKTITDVLLSIQTLTSSESSYSQARHQFILNQLLLKQTAGTIAMKDLETVNALLQ
ncbi:MAG: TolC family outer membrane protein [Rhodanobacter sp.]